jgi:biopolymer transport protein ExbB
MVAHVAAATVSHVPRVAAWIVQEGGAVGWDPISLWKQMGIIAKAVVVILFIMSGWSIGVMIDRAMAYSAARKQSRAFAPAVAGALRDGRIDEAIKVAERNKKSHLAKVVTAGLMEFKAHQDSPGAIPGETIEASKRALERTEAIVHAELKRGLGGLATIGSTAPFVGLFGTVMGILNAFKGISEQKATGLGAVAGGISEALVTTAFGLLVAIPAVMMFNYLTGRVEAFDVEMDNSSSELIDYFLKRRDIAARR